MTFATPRLEDKNVITQGEWKLTIDGLPNIYFTKMSPPKEVKENGTYFDGISNRKRYTNGGTFSCDNITLEIPYDIETFKTICDWANEFRDGSVTEIAVRPVAISSSGGVTPHTQATYLINARYASLEIMGSVDKSSSEVNMTKLEFTIEAFEVR